MPAPEESKDNKSLENQKQPVRELTQTDHLNKKLLTSLLSRMDEGGNSALAKMLEPDNNDEDSNEWKD